MRLALVLPLLAAASIAQADVKPFEINMDRVTMEHKGSFGGSKTYIIPTVYVRLMARTQTEIANKGSSGASVKAKILMDGFDKKQVQGLAQQIQDDLVAKLKAAGYTVLTYADIKDELKDAARKKVNEKFGFPTDLLEGGKGVDFAIVTPTDEQSIDFGFTGVTWPYKAIAKQHNAVVLVPDLRFSITEVTGETSSNAFQASAKLNILPVMKLDQVMVTALEPSLAAGYFLIQEHGKRLAGENVGTIKKVSEDNNNYAGWSRTVGDYSFTINHEALNESVLRVGHAVNDLTVDTAKKAH